MDITLEDEQLREKLHDILQELLDSGECYGMFSVTPDKIASARRFEIYNFATKLLGRNHKLGSLT